MKLIDTMEGVAEALRTISLNCGNWQISSLACSLINEINGSIAEYNRPVEVKDLTDWRHRPNPFEETEMIHFIDGLQFHPATESGILFVCSPEGDLIGSEQIVTVGELEVVRRLFGYE